MFFNPLTPIESLSTQLEHHIRNHLWLQVVCGLVLGVLTGYFLSQDFGLFEAPTASMITNWLALPGALFLRLIKMVLVPLVMASIIRGIGATTDITLLKIVGKKFFVFVLLTTFLSVVLGVTLANLISPGEYVHFESGSLRDTVSIPQVALNHSTIPDFLVQLIPENPLSSMISGEMFSIVVFPFSWESHLLCAPIERFLHFFKCLMSFWQSV